MAGERRLSWAGVRRANSEASMAGSLLIDANRLAHARRQPLGVPLVPDAWRERLRPAGPRRSTTNTLNRPLILGIFT